MDNTASEMTDIYLTKLVRYWLNKASPGSRRESIYYTQTDIDEYSWVFFVEHFLKLPGFNADDYTDKQGNLCAHICCDILYGLTESLFNKPL